MEPTLKTRLLKVCRDTEKLYDSYVDIYKVYKTKQVKLFCIHLGGVLGKTNMEVGKDLGLFLTDKQEEK